MRANVSGGDTPAQMTWERRGDWLRSDSGRFLISRLHVFHGAAYSAWDWYPENDWAPIHLGVYDSADKAKSRCEMEAA